MDSALTQSVTPTEYANKIGPGLNPDATIARLYATGVAGLDDILGGGMVRNHLYLIEGDPGTGKTTIAMQFLMEGSRLGQKGLYITLSESKIELLEIAESHGWCLDGIEIFELAADEQLLDPEAQYTIFNPSKSNWLTPPKRFWLRWSGCSQHA